MARIIFPGTFNDQRQLLSDVIAKDTTLGIASPIRPYMTEQGIVLADDNTAGGNALLKEVLRGKKSREAEALREARDKLWLPVQDHMRGEIQFLKRFYRNVEHKLGDWGVTVNGNRIAYPVTLQQWIDLLGNINTKHGTFPPGMSPLEAYLTQNNITLATDITSLATAQTDDLAAAAASKESEDATEERDTLWNPVIKHLEGIGQFLIGLNNKTPKEVGNWGYVVDESPRDPKLRTTNLKIGETKTITSVTIGGTFTNLGATDLHLYRGKTTSGTPTIIRPGEKMGMTKGFSTITVSNPNTLVPGKFTVLVSR